MWMSCTLFIQEITALLYRHRDIYDRLYTNKGRESGLQKHRCLVLMVPSSVFWTCIWNNYEILFVVTLSNLLGSWIKHLIKLMFTSGNVKQRRISKTLPCSVMWVYLQSEYKKQHVIQSGWSLFSWCLSTLDHVFLCSQNFSHVHEDLVRVSTWTFERKYILIILCLIHISEIW